MESLKVAVGKGGTLNCIEFGISPEAIALLSAAG